MDQIINWIVGIIIGGVFLLTLYRYIKKVQKGPCSGGCQHCKTKNCSQRDKE